MRKVIINAPVECVLPIGYDLSMRLDGENSYLEIKEYYPKDAPDDLYEKTIEIIRVLARAQNKEVSAKALPEMHGASIILKGNEEQIIAALVGEFRLWEQYSARAFGYYPAPPSVK